MNKMWKTPEKPKIQGFFPVPAGWGHPEILVTFGSRTGFRHRPGRCRLKSQKIVCITLF